MPSALSVISALPLLSALSALSPPAHACGPFFDSALYTWPFRPEGPWAEAIRRPGLPDPGWWSTFQILSWRQLQGRPISEAEGAQFAAAWDHLIDPPEGAGADPWLEARKRWRPDTGAYLSPWKDIPDTYNSFLNCTTDAFLTAAATGEARRSALPAAEFDLWLAGQDRVFDACRDPEAPEPEPLPKESSRLLLQDRAWQQAAWSFYRQRFDEAEARFTSIAASVKSPWSGPAKLLLARTSLRRNSLDGAATLDLAEARLSAVLQDRRLADLHPSAERLLRLARQRKESRSATIGRLAGAIDAGTGSAQDIIDLSVLLDRQLSAVTDYDEDGDPQIPPGAEVTRGSAMIDWILAFHWGHLEGARAAWSRTHDPIWLAALIGGPGGLTPELEAEARKVPMTHPAAAALALPLIAADVRADPQQARDRIAALMATDLPRASRARLIRHRVQVATSLDAFLKDAWMQPLAYGDFFRAVEYVEDPALGPALLPEAADILNGGLPLTVLQLIATHPDAPATARTPLLISALVRAVLLDNDASLTAIAPALAAALPAFAPDAAAIAAAPDAAARRALAALFVLRNPGADRDVWYDFGREIPLNTLDDYRRNWWGGEIAEVPPVTFLTSADQARAAAERAALQAAGPAGDAIGAFLLPWLREHPDAPFAAEALHHIVRATRFTVSGQGKTSKAAYTMLHKGWPDSAWAQKTPYWFD